jgi:iron complex outermembrane receptor protein
VNENSTRAQIASAISESAAHGTAFARSMLGVGLGVLIALAPALSAAVETGPREADEDTNPLQEVVVTGSHFKTLNESSPSPVVVLGNEELQHMGTARAEDLLNSLPQANVGLSLAANGAGVSPLTGTATVDLRGIGAFNTLVLMNGRRLNPGDSINPSADLNTIPTALVKRVEVLTGGASSIYGSDAISGVVNFVMDTEFTGAKFEIEDSLNRGSNNRSDLQAIARASGVSPRTGTVYDGRTLDMSGVFGTDLFGADGHITAYAGYRHTAGVLASSRDFSACTLQEAGSSYQCLLDGTTGDGQFAPGGGAGPALTLDRATGNTFRAFDNAADSYNPAPFQTLQRPDTRYNAGVFARYNFSTRAQSYLEAQFSDDHTTVQYEPSGTTPTGAGLNLFDVNCNNPLLSANQVDALCTQYGLGAADTAQVAIGRRNVEGGLRGDDFRHRSYRVLLGLKGDINPVWSYDVNAQYGNTDSHERITNDVSQSKLARSLNVVSVGGVPTCQSVVDGSDPSCVPYNIFSVGGVTPAALRYITEGGSQTGFARQTVVDGKVIGELGKYGIRSPMAEEGLNVAAGAEYRTQTISNLPDAAYTTGDLLVTGAARPTVGTYHVAEVFGEIRIPLIEKRPFAQSLTLDISDRYARYSPQGPANAFNVGAEWAPVDLVRFRGSLSRAVRAPNGHELFLSEVLSQFPLSDPCANDPTTGVPTASAAACANSGVTAAQYGKIPAANSFNQVTGGNPNLKPQTADTFTTGVVFTPVELVRNLIVSADYWRIKVKHYIGSLSAGDTLNNCINSGDPRYCSLVLRDANGSLSVGNGPTAGRVIGTGLNTGSFEMSGVDIDGHYVLDLNRAGTVAFSFNGSVAVDNTIEVVPGLPAFDCTGFYGPTCTGEGPTSPIPKWRHKLRATWESPRGFEVSLNWRHIGSLSSEQTSSSPHLATGTAYPADSHVGSYEYFDIDTGIDLGSHVNLRFGVNNLLDRKPPIVGFNANPLLVNGNMLAAMYDTLGRYIFIGATLRY